MIGTFSATEVRILFRMLEPYGVDGMELCRRAGLNTALINDTRARYPAAPALRVWGMAVKATGNPHLGLEMSKFYRATDFHGLAVVFLASQTLRTALQRLVRYHSVVNTALSMSLQQHEQRLDLLSSTMMGDEDGQRALDDARAVVVLDLCRSGATGTLDPVELAFPYPRPSRPTDHAALFRCPVVFGAPQWRLSFRAEDADRPFLASNRELARSNDQILERMVNSLRRDDLGSRVKMAMVEELASGTPTQEAVARAVSMSTRSLQRRLAEDGTSFTELLAAVRRELAEQYVLDPKIPVTEISYMLGFSDVSSFSRAFKRWTGSSPASAREAGSQHATEATPEA